MKCGIWGGIHNFQLLNPTMEFTFSVEMWQKTIDILDYYFVV